MDYFEKFTNSLPPVLSRSEQEQLLLTYYETHDGDVREKLLEHNLRLCLQCTSDFCKRYNMQDREEDMFSICYEELSRSLDRFNPTQGVPFASFVMNNMKLKLISASQKESYYNFPLVDTEITEQDPELEESVTEDLFAFLQDDSFFPDEVASELFREDILKFIERSRQSDKNKEMVKMYLSLGYPKYFNKTEIAEHFQVSKQHASRTISDFMILIQKYIAKNYASILPDYAKKVIHNSKSFKTLEERDQYIFESYYDANNQKSTEDLASELGLTSVCIRNIAYNQKSASKTTPQTQHSRKKPKTSYDDQIESIFNDFYGIGSSKYFSPQELISKYNLPPEPNYISHVIASISNTLIEQGKYTSAEIRQLKQHRNDHINQSLLKKLESVYHSANGDDGYEHKSKVRLAQEHKVTVSTINAWLKQYKDYLDAISEQNDSQSEPNN